MKEEEKAKELVGRFYCHGQKRLQGDKLAREDAKQCALLCIDEIIEALEDNHDYEKCNIEFTYWKNVKQFIEKL